MSGLAMSDVAFDTPMTSLGNITSSYASEQVDRPLHRSASVGTLLALIAFGAVIGNVLVIASVATERRLRTITNRFVVSLATADLMVGLLVLPPAIKMEITGRRWLLGPVMCDVWISFDVMLCTASILNLCCISVDRYLAVTRPLQSATGWRSKRLANVMIAVVWIAAVFITCPPLLGWRESGRHQRLLLHLQNKEQLMSMEHGNRSVPSPVTAVVLPDDGHDAVETCTLTGDPGYVIYSALGSFYVPLAVMLFVYANIFKVVRARMRPMQSDAGDSLSGRHVSSSGIRLQPAAAYLNSSSVSAQQSLTRNGYCGYICRMCCTLSTSTYGNSMRVQNNSIQLRECRFKKRTIAGNSVNDPTDDDDEQINSSDDVNSDLLAGGRSSLDADADGVFAPADAWRQQVESTRGDTPHGMRMNRTKSSTESGEDCQVTAVNQRNSCHSVAVPHPNIIQLPIKNESSSRAANRHELCTHTSHSASDSTLLRSLHRPASASTAMTRSIYATLDRDAVRCFRQPTSVNGGHPSLHSSASERSAVRREGKTAKTLSIVVGGFIVCWLPFFVVYIVEPFCPLTLCSITEELRSFCTWLGYANSLINPFIYAAYNPYFRSSF